MNISDIVTIIKDFGVGGIIGGIAVSWYKSYSDEKCLKKSIANALIAEMSSLRDSWKKSNSGGLKAVVDFNPYANVPFWKVEGNYFIVFDNNCDKIGAFGSEDIKKLTSLYTEAKGFVDSLRTWSKMVDNFREDIAKDLRYADIYKPKLLYYYNNILVQSQDMLFVKMEDVIDRLKKYT